MRYCINFRKLDSVQQQNIIGVNNNFDNEEEEEDNDDDDENDVDHITLPPIGYHYVARAGDFHW